MLTYNFAGIQVSQQAFLILLAGSTLSALMLIGSLFLPGALKFIGLFMSLITFGLTCFAGYQVNCTIVGKCHKLAWVLVAVDLIVFVGYAVQFWTIYQTGKMVSYEQMSPSRSSRSPRGRRSSRK
jgi:hypothetical protein